MLFLLLLLSIKTIFATKPNILIYIADDLGQGEINQQSFENSFLLNPINQQLPQLINTPNLEKFSKESENFHHTWTSSVCSPSRYTLITEKEIDIKSSIRGNGDLGNNVIWNKSNIFKRFKNIGYKTGYIGKFGFGNPYNKINDIDYYYGPDISNKDDTHKLSHILYPSKVIENNEIINIKKNKNTNKRKCFFKKQCEYLPNLLFQKTLNFINNNKNPWFLLYSTPLNHVGKWSKNDIKFTSPVDYIDKRINYIKNFDRKAHLTMIYMIDNEIGQLMNIVNNNTIVVFTSDNGAEYEYINGKTRYPNYFTSTGGRRGIKRTPYEGGINVPMMIRWPNELCMKHNYKPIGFNDLGRLLYDKNSYEYKDYLSLVYCDNDIDCVSILMDSKNKLKLIKFNNRYELYDLVNDPTESINIKNIPQYLLDIINK